MTGSRLWTDTSLIEVVLESVLRQSGLKPEEITVVHGNCHLGGADIIASVAAEQLGMIPEPHDANFEELGPKAGPLRNQEMVDLGADLCLAFPLPGSRGTADCMKRADQAGIPVHVFEAFR